MKLASLFPLKLTKTQSKFKIDGNPPKSENKIECQ
jgi:hypothetical protein